MSRMIFAAPRRLAGLLRHKAGLAMTEFALMAPILLVGGVVGLEFVNYTLARQKMERLAGSTADLVARNQIPPNESQIKDVFLAVNQIADPFDLKTHGRVIVTGVVGVTKDGQPENRIVWQRCSGSLAGQTSQIGTEWTGSSNYSDGPAITLPNNIVLNQSNMVVVAEVYYQYQPLINVNLIPRLPTNAITREQSVFRTRGRAFTSITPVAGVTADPC